MATRAWEYAKTTGKVLAIAGIILGAVGGAIAGLHAGLLILPGILLGAAITGAVWGIGGGILGAAVGVFFRKKETGVGDDNQQSVKMGRSAQMEQSPSLSQGTARGSYRDMVTAQRSSASTEYQR